MFDVTAWETNNYNTHIAPLRSNGDQKMKFG